MKEKNFDFSWVTIPMYAILFYQKDVAYRPEQIINTEDVSRNLVYNGIAEGVEKHKWQIKCQNDKFSPIQITSHQLDYGNFPWFEIAGVTRPRFDRLIPEIIVNSTIAMGKCRETLIEYLEEHVTTQSEYDDVSYFIVTSCQMFEEWTNQKRYTKDGKIDRPPLEFRKIANLANVDIDEDETLKNLYKKM